MKNTLKKYGSAAIIVLLCLGCVAAGIVWRQEIWMLITSQAARDDFILWVQSKGLWGVLVFLALEVFQIVVAVVPGEPIQLMAGALFGPIGGLFICLAGILLGSAFIYVLVKAMGAKAVSAKTLSKYRFLQDEKKARSALYLLFFLPGIPKDMLTYAGPFLPIRMGEFLFVSTMARIPFLLTSSVAGASLADGNLWLPVVLVAVTGAIGLVCIRSEEKILNWLHTRLEKLRTK